MRFGSLCSGIEAASVAWRCLGWDAEYFAENDKWCSLFLSVRYPGIPNYGDITTIAGATKVDVVVGGTPCQSFSVNGMRKGMDDSRGNLALHFCRIVLESSPRWFVWENVPGVLSTNGGRDFGSFLGAMANGGYGIAWRVLDARHFGVPQRRRRVFVVGRLGSRRSAAAVLFDAPSCGRNGSQAQQISRRLSGKVQGSVDEPLLGWTGDETPKHGIEICPTLRASQGGEGVGVLGSNVFRRLTPTEWERLQGMPDGYTAIDGATVRQRIKAIGNSFCVPVLRWIGTRIAEIEK